MLTIILFDLTYFGTMSGNEPLSTASVREFLVKNNGKVKNIDLVTHFRQQLNDPANKSKARADFKEIVHTLATVQTIDGEKYFVLKRPKEAPAVMRKPPRPSTRKDRPVSGPPVFRGAKLEEVNVGSAAIARSHPGEESPELSHANKENRALDRRDGQDSAVRHLVHTGSLDSGLNTETASGGGHLDSIPQLSQKDLLHPNKGNDNLDRLSQVSSEEMDPVEEDMEGDDLMVGPTIHLEPLEKEWFITAAKGNRAQIMCLLEQDPNLATKKDFIMGYSALHWAAKHGRDDIVKLLAGTGIDVNIRTNGGYTPLHLAALHGHDAVIKMLVAEFDADINVRDYSGKKPRQVAKESLTIEAQGRLEHFRGYSDSSSESGYSSLYSKRGSTNSMVTPSVLLASQFGGSEKGASKNEATEEKTRTRTTSFGRFLKKKPKKERPHIGNITQSSMSAGLLISSPVSLERGPSFDQSPDLSKRTYSDPNLLQSTGV